MRLQCHPTGGSAGRHVAAATAGATTLLSAFCLVFPCFLVGTELFSLISQGSLHFCGRLMWPPFSVTEVGTGHGALILGPLPCTIKLQAVCTGHRLRSPHCRLVGRLCCGNKCKASRSQLPARHSSECSAVSEHLQGPGQQHLEPVVPAPDLTGGRSCLLPDL